MKYELLAHRQHIFQSFKNNIIDDKISEGWKYTYAGDIFFSFKI